ncbi:MAG: hypothetical protein U9R19_02475, partial [Bacteroidota bacterium]|nr:hypothetical protein [Bacteroidota bacterium]
MDIFCKYKLKFDSFIIFLIIILNFFISADLLSQSNEIGLPQIRNYLPKEYGTDPQNFSVAQDLRGVMYFGNMSGILEFDEISWRLIKIQGWPYLTSCCDGRIYVGAFNDFGYLAPDSSGLNNFFSLKDKFLKDDDFGAVFNIVSSGGQIFFETDNKLFRYANDVVELLDTNSSRYTVFKAGKEIFINHSVFGLVKYTNSEFKKLPNGKYFIGKDILDILPFNKSILIKVNSVRGLLEYDFQ